MDAYLSLVDELVRRGVLRRRHIIDAFLRIHREEFLPLLLRDRAGEDSPLPIGYGQTISQPYTVAFMLELLNPQKGQKIMDIGYGSGWTSALLAHIAGEKGMVCAIEIIPELCAFGKANIAQVKGGGMAPVEIFCQDGRKGLPRAAPFDRILAGAGASRIPRAWLSQLADGGRLVVPVKESIILAEKKEKRITYKEYHGFLFVPLVYEK